MNEITVTVMEKKSFVNLAKLLFGQFYHSKIEVKKWTFASVSLVWGKSERIERKTRKESSGLELLRTVNTWVLIWILKKKTLECFWILEINS